MGTRNVLFTISATAASGLLLYFGTGLHPVWWLLWLAPVPVLAIAPQLTRGAAFAIALVAWLIWGSKRMGLLQECASSPAVANRYCFLRPSDIFRARRSVHA